MLDVEQLGARIIIGFGDGSLFITESTLFGLIVAVILAILGIWMGSGLQKVPKGNRYWQSSWWKKYTFIQKTMLEKNICLMRLT